MAGPSPAFLQQLYGGLDPNMGIPPPPAPPSPPAPALPPGVVAAPPAPPPPPPAPPQPVDMGNVEDWGAPAAQPVSAAAPADGAGPEREPPPLVQTMPVHTPGHPAGEVHVRGPKQEELLQASFEPGQEAADRIQLRSGIQAQHESDLYEQQAEHFQRQQEAMERVQAKRSFELQQLRSDYEQTIDRLGKASIDSGRMWANMSTMDKIGATILVMIGSAAGGAEHGIKFLEKRIEDDVKQQKFDYEKGLDLAKHQQTAYGMAMQQYGEEDAAYHMAMAAGQQAAAMKVHQMQAQWKGTNAANEADMMRGQLQAGAFKSAAEGFRYVPASIGGTKYMVAVRGQIRPGLASEADAQKVFDEHGTKPFERMDDSVLKGRIESGHIDQKAFADRAGKGDEGARHIATQLQTAGVPAARAAAERALQTLNKSPGGTGEVVARGAIKTVPVVGEGLSNKVMSEDANAREQAYQQFANAAMKAMMGNVTASEEERARRALGNAADPESRRRAIAMALETLDEVEKNAKAGERPEAQAEFDRRREAAKSGKPAAPASASKGWK